VRLCVEDVGAGMAPHVLARVFEPFFTTRAVGRGSGLGLSVCLGIIKQAGGHIALTSVVGRGTHAVVHLPVARGAADQPATTDASRHLRGHETVLVVEDEPVVQKLVQRSLSSLGYNVLAARDAAHALELLGSDKHDVGVLLTDVVMPDMSGPALAQRARVINPCLPVLFMTGYLDDLSQGQMREVVDSQVLVKPFSHPQLAARIRSLLDGA
jgi:CheY-like chemotaxis protein